MGMRVQISRSLLDAIQHESVIVSPNEACGLLFGADGEVTGWQAAENVAETPELRFEIDPTRLFAALRAERQGGAKIAGYWHSHPSGDTGPSLADAEMAQPDGKLWLIVAGARASMWRSVAGGMMHDRFNPVELRIV